MYIIYLAARYAVRRENKFEMAGSLKHLATRYSVSNICKRRSESITCVVPSFRVMD